MDAGAGTGGIAGIKAYYRKARVQIEAKWGNFNGYRGILV